MTRHAHTALVLLTALLMAACQKNGDDNSRPTSPTSPTGPSSSGSTMPNISGIWRGYYVAYGEISGNDGVMTWNVQQSGSRITGTFTIQGDFLLGTVTGSISGTSAGSSGSTPNQYAVTLSSSSVSLFPGCTMVLRARQSSLVTSPRSLNGSYKQALCGYSSDLENGQYVLSKQ